MVNEQNSFKETSGLFLKVNPVFVQHMSGVIQVKESSWNVHRMCHLQNAVFVTVFNLQVIRHIFPISA